MIDFKELPPDGRGFEQLVREILLVMDLHPQWSGQGQDQGRDLIAREKLTGSLGHAERVWLVQCKHHAHSGRAVGREDVGSVIDDCSQVGASGYLLVCSTHPSSSLVTKLSEISARPDNGIVTKIWDGVDIEKLLTEPRLFALGHLFFPLSFAGSPWRLYNRGSPNRWTAHFRTYFIHLSSRISGSYPDLKECEHIVGLLERIRPTNQAERIRPRSIYFDDKHQNFVVSADYLVPVKQEPSLSPSDFNRVLSDGEGLHVADDGGMYYLTSWDIQLRRVIPGSDHFHVDHYEYYDPYDGDYQIGVSRGLTIGDMEAYSDTWRDWPRRK